MAVCVSPFLCLYLLPGTVSFLFFSSLFHLLESYISPFLCLFESDSPCSALALFQSPCTITPFLSFSVSSSLLLSLSFPLCLPLSQPLLSPPPSIISFTLKSLSTIFSPVFLSLSVFLTHSLLICLSLFLFATSLPLLKLRTRLFNGETDPPPPPRPHRSPGSH